MPWKTRIAIRLILWVAVFLLDGENMRDDIRKELKSIITALNVAGKGAFKDE